MDGMRTIVLCTDFSAFSRAAFPHAFDLARRFGATVHLVNVLEEPLPIIADEFALGLDSSANAAARLEVAVEQLNVLAHQYGSAENMPVVPVQLRGFATREIAQYALANHADCIVLATHGRTGLLHFLYGSVAEALVRAAPCPVYTIHPTTDGIWRHVSHPEAETVIVREPVEAEAVHVTN